MRTEKQRLVQGKRVLLFLLLPVVMYGAVSSYCAETRVVLLDVGMGQSLLLVDGDHGLLVDTGSAEYASHVLSTLQTYGVKHLDYLLLTHLHPDHAAGYFEIRKAWPNVPVLESCYIPEVLHPVEQDHFFNIHSALILDPLRGCLHKGDTIQWQGHEVKVLWPDVFTREGLNYHSLVLLVTFTQGQTLLIMGDAGRRVENRLLEPMQALVEKRGVDIFVVGHHAASDSSDAAFLAAVRPDFSIVSVGADNPYGYPSEWSLAVLNKHSRNVLRTDRDGEICFALHSKRVTLCK